MRINIYAEELSTDIEIIEKTTPDGKFTGLRMYMYLPVTLPDGTQVQGKFMHHPGDDDSAAVTFWGKKDLRQLLRKALVELDSHYGDKYNVPVLGRVAYNAGHSISENPFNEAGEVYGHNQWAQEWEAERDEIPF